jgi:outer membrane receptor protein involved in Fe transport
VITLAMLLLGLPGGVVHGTVRADSTMEPIAYAMVEVEQLGRRAVADERGYYVLADVPPGAWTIRFTAIGYRAREVDVEIAEGQKVRLDIALQWSPVQLAGLEVLTEAQNAASVVAPGPPPARVDGPSLSILPGLAEADVFRALEALPSVAAMSDFSSAFYVRGGAPDQNLILLDGAPLFNPFHLGGVFAAFDPSAIATVDVLPGAFPASAGDRMSSVISLNTRDGGRDRIRGNGAIGLISSRASVDGPLPGGKGSYLLSLRRTYVDLFTDVAYELDLLPVTVPYAFTDGHLKLTHDVGAGGSIAASLYADREAVRIPREMVIEDGTDARFTWGSYAAALEYRQPLGGTWHARLRGAWSAFRGDFQLWERRDYGAVESAPDEAPTPGFEHTLDALSHMRDVVAGVDLTWYGRSHRVGLGVQMDAYLFDHRVGPEGHALRSVIPPFERTDRVTTLAGYVEDEWAPTESLRLRGGVRVLHADDRGTVWMPRLGARYALGSGFTVNLGAGRYAQVMHSLRSEEAVLSSLVAYDLLGAVRPGERMPTTDDLVLGLEWRESGTVLRVDGYLKRTAYLLLAPLPDNPMDAPIVVTEGRTRAEALARGVEATLRHRRGEAEISASYALAFAEIEQGGVRYPPRYDRRHTLDLSTMFPFGRRGLFSARLVAATGQPFTPATGRATFLHYDPGTGRYRQFVSRMVLLGEHNSERLPTYLRLDVAVRKEYEKSWFGGIKITPYLQILNVLNSRNVLAAEPNQHYFPTGEVANEYYPQLPFLPTFGVEWRF